MAYEIDYIGVKADKATKDADAICLRWKTGIALNGMPIYKVGVIDGGFEAHGNAMIAHMNQYYFDDAEGVKSKEKKTIDFVVVTHPDQDHAIGLKQVLKAFDVKKIYMNRPWLYVDELFDKVNDGRITKQSLRERLRNNYETIADIENIAEENKIPIYEAFEGTYVENEILILSPEKQFYLDLLVESEKTPLQEQAAFNQDGLFGRIANAVKAYIVNKFEDWDIETLRENEETSAENETSVVLRGLVEGDGFLLTGDAGIRALNKAIDYMEQIGEDVISEISFYQIPHHGGRHNVSPSLLDRMVGQRVKKGATRNKTAYASVAEGSDHPLKMVTNAYIRRGVSTYETNGNTICHHCGQMPKRGWTQLKMIEFADYVEEWDD
jgi:beta-lactamase superfamily II metal-dependent hydrolase